MKWNLWDFWFVLCWCAEDTGTTQSKSKQTIWSRKLAAENENDFKIILKPTVKTTFSLF